MKKIIVILFACLLVSGAAVHAGGLIVITNRNVPVSSLSNTDVQNIFLGKNTSWSDGRKIIPAVLKGGGAHAAFMNDILGKSEGQFDTYWKKAIFTGTGKPPRTVGSEAEMVQFVASTDGAVGYIDSDTAHANVKSFTVK